MEIMQSFSISHFSRAKFFSFTKKDLLHFTSCSYLETIKLKCKIQNLELSDLIGAFIGKLHFLHKINLGVV